MIKLSPETDWLLYVGSPGYSFPDYSPNTNLNQFTLKRNTSSFISFKPEKYVRLARRGYFDTEDHCMENIELSDTITCFKKCFVERLEVLSFLSFNIGPSVDDQAVSRSDDGTTIIIDFFSSFFSLLFSSSFYRHSTRHTLHLHFNPD